MSHPLSGVRMILLAAIAAHCAPASGALFIVDSLSRSFSPADTTVNIGDTVRWTGLQNSPGHNVVQVSQVCWGNANCTTPLVGGFNSGAQGAVAQFEFTFNTPGTYYFICQPHQDDGMRGRIFVNSGPTPSPTPSMTPTPSPSPTATPTPPVNDNCAAAICLSDGMTYNGTSAGATGTDITSCGTGDTSDVWFTYTPITSGDHMVSTCGTNTFNHTLAAFTSCGGAQISCVDLNSCSGAPQEQLPVSMTAGTTYYIRLAGVSGATGAYQITVTGGGGGCGNNASVSGHTIPAQIPAGHPINVDVTMLNTGNTTWTNAGGFFLAVTLDSCTMGPGTMRVDLPAGASILPGSTHTFNLTLNPPVGLQICNLSFRMSQTGPGNFGATLALTPETIAVVNNSQFMGNNVPAQMPTSQNIYAGVTVKNLGNAQWTPGGPYTLAKNSDTCTIVESAAYGPHLLVAPNGTLTFLIYLKAPGAPASCQFQLQMRDGATPFGPTADFSINVVTPPNAAVDWSRYE